MKEQADHHLSPPRSQQEPRFIISTDYKQWASRAHIFRPPTDVYETEISIVVRVEIAGMRSADFTISLENRYLAVRGIRSAQVEQCAYYQMEIASGEFLSLVELPAPVDYDKIEAHYDDGFLTVTLPKSIEKNVDVKTRN